MICNKNPHRTKNGKCVVIHFHKHHFIINFIFKCLKYIFLIAKGNNTRKEIEMMMIII